jgi:hypothetical protein
MPMETAVSNAEPTTATVPGDTAAAPAGVSSTPDAAPAAPAANGTPDSAVDRAVDSAPAAPAEDAPTRGRPRKQSTARKTRTVELTLTVTGTAEGEWQAELTHAGKRVVQGLAVSAAAVARAAKELSPEISDEIETVITAAREQHQARVAELEAELNKAKAALAELED